MIASEFQYISCYCLSNTYVQIHMDCTSFQYISCYCLSRVEKYLEVLKQNFNTSHVTVYQKCVPISYVSRQISIHLMLLFIRPYRCCYNRVSEISIHLMLLFILSGLTFLYLLFNISIHLMLLFIAPSCAYILTAN